VGYQRSSLSAVARLAYDTPITTATNEQPRLFVLHASTSSS
jgi:hypothetical protein